METITDMHNQHAIRHQNLRRLVERHGGVVALAQQLGRDSSQISRWLAWPGKHSRTISHKMASHIEASLQLPAGWMDTPHSNTPTEQHPLLDAACTFLASSPDPAVADILAQLLRAITPPPRP